MLQLQLSKSQEKLVEALRGQQDEVQELQRLLGEQQGTLVSQQREILEQQRKMYDQMEQVRFLGFDDAGDLGSRWFEGL